MRSPVTGVAPAANALKLLSMLSCASSNALRSPHNCRPADWGCNDAAGVTIDRRGMRGQGQRRKVR